MANLGIHVFEKATSVSTPKVAAVGIPFVVGTAPVHTAEKPAAPNTPVLATSWDEAVEKLGFSYDWEAYSLCEFMYSHFQLFGAQPVIFCNILDPEAMKKDVAAADYDVADHKITLPIEAVAGSIQVKVTEDVEGTPTQRELAADEDYSVFYDRDGTDTYVCIVELLENGSAYSAAKVNIAYTQADPKATTVADVVDGVAQADACLTAVGVVPDLICAPGWSHIAAVAAVMTTKAAAVNGLFKGKAVIDVDSTDSGVTEYYQIPAYKNKNSLVDADQILCWPMVQLGDYRFHLSTQLCGLMAEVDALNGGIPYESPSNKNLKMDACVLADGRPVNLTWEQVNLVAGSWGAVTAVNFMDSGWVAKGNYTACYPGNTDVKDQFIPVSRMFDFIGNTLIRTFWSKLDKPMTTALRDSILQTCNIWLGGLSGGGYLYGARAELLAEENPLANLLDGHITLHVYNAPPVPAQEIDFILEYDVSYMETALSA
ncbi:phage tail protein [Pseudoflavonifractor sp. 524-17]|uniref:phage tail sheath family protein n=1 Tax=Pseudoflavonifractor sp. 524-17 TaxID=2304577 RepID=UPI00137B51A7|nr:phage tail protein [Pseudoflavonifractor sp. 524-17]NCE63023.1 phage tail protein [Pseudoflavonifractor sp. 524-17]